MMRLLLILATFVASTSGVAGMQFLESSLVDSGGGLQGFVADDETEAPNAASRCKSPIEGLGCIDVGIVFKEAWENRDLIFGEEGAVAAIMDDAIAPIIDFVIENVPVFNGGPLLPGLKTGFCFGEFSGEAVTKSPVWSVFRKHSCELLPLVDDHTYLITSMGLPTEPFIPLCPGAIIPDDLISFCSAFSLCDGNLPTLGFMISGPLIACVSGNAAVIAATGGISSALLLAVKAGGNQIGFGFSLGASLQHTVEVWDGEAMVSAQVFGNYFDYVKVNFAPLDELLGLKDTLEVRGFSVRVISIIGDAGATVDALATSDSPQDAIATIVKNFAAVMEMFVGVIIRLRAISYGILADTPPLKIASFGAVASAQPKERTGVPEGFYATCRGFDVLTVVVTEVLKYISDTLGGIVDSIFGEGSMEGFLKAATPTGGADTIFAFAANKHQVGFFVQAPVAALLFGPFAGDLAGVFSVGCKVRFSDGHFSCEMDYTKPKWVSGFVDGVLYIAKEAKEFFDETGKIIATVFKEQGKNAAEWTKTNINKAAKKVLEHLKDFGDDVKEWAQVGGGYLHCGAKYVVDGVECGTDYIEDGAKCGWDYVKDGAKCGTKFLADAAKCGVNYVKDAAKCGTSVIANVAKCGWKILGQLCSGCSGCSGCTWGGCSGCSGCSGCFKKKIVAKCRIAKSCNVARRCDVPQWCNIGRKCDVPLSCQIPKHC